MIRLCNYWKFIFPVSFSNYGKEDNSVAWQLMRKFQTFLLPCGIKLCNLKTSSTKANSFPLELKFLLISNQANLAMNFQVLGSSGNCWATELFHEWKYKNQLKLSIMQKVSGWNHHSGNFSSRNESRKIATLESSWNFIETIFSGLFFSAADSDSQCAWKRSQLYVC